MSVTGVAVGDGDCVGGTVAEAVGCCVTGTVAVAEAVGAVVAVAVCGAPVGIAVGLGPGGTVAVAVVTGFGWTPARVLAINGNSYRVLANGVPVTKDYPADVRRIGAVSTVLDPGRG